MLQLLRALTTKKGGWANHPAALMWKGYERALAAYGLAICEQWVARRNADTVAAQILAIAGEPIPTQDTVELPPWLGRESFHASHRGNLLRKDADWYGTFGWTDSPLLPYEWPVNDDPRLFNFVRR